MPLWTKINNMESASPMMEQLTFFNDLTLTMMLMILTITSLMMIFTLKTSFSSNKNFTNQTIEIFWTILPSIILVMIAMPSLKIVYMMEELTSPTISMKTMGHQWYWTYEYSDTNQIEMESYMLKNKKKFRLLDVENHTVLPMLTKIRMIISSTDVLHSWTIPVLGLKMDAVPGRLNQIMIMINKPGVFFGQCSEICSTNHSFMPIVLESVNMKTFLKWLKS